jgi:hypothetical protein
MLNNKLLNLLVQQTSEKAIAFSMLVRGYLELYLLGPKNVVVGIFCHHIAGGW